MKRISMLTAFIVFIYTAACSQQKVYNILDFGAVADGKTINTKAIQKAIDEASALGGARVLVPAGKFVTGTLNLKSNIDFHVAGGAILLGSDKRADYDGFKPLSLLYAKDQQNISITGKGIIDGQSREFMKDVFKRLIEGSLSDPGWELKRPGEASRNFLVFYENCDKVTLRNITLKDPSSWVHNARNSTHITIDSVRVDAVAYWNNDGLDFDDCRDVRITNCTINSADDGICLKSGSRDKGCENFYIGNCTIRSSASALKFGTSGFGGFRHIVVRGLTIFDTYRSAIAIEAVDGGIVDDVDIRNISAKNTGNAIFIHLGHRNADTVYSKIRNVYIANVKVEVPKGKPDAGYETEGPLLKYPPAFKQAPGKIVSLSPYNNSTKDPNVILYPHNVFPSSVTGLPGYPVENVTLENIEIRYQGGADKKKACMPLDSLAIITEAATNYPEFSMFGELPAWGFFVRHVNKLTMKNITIQYDEGDFRTAMVFDDAQQLKLDAIQIPTSGDVPVIYLNNSPRPLLSNIKIPFPLKKGIIEK